MLCKTLKKISAWLSVIPLAAVTVVVFFGLFRSFDINKNILHYRNSKWYEAENFDLIYSYGIISLRHHTAFSSTPDVEQFPEGNRWSASAYTDQYQSSLGVLQKFRQAATGFFWCYKMTDTSYNPVSPIIWRAFGHSNMKRRFGSFEFHITRQVSLPIWTLLLTFGIFPAIRLVRHITRVRRRRHGRCVVCGYDLRGSPGRCPECGEMPDSASPASATEV